MRDTVITKSPYREPSKSARPERPVWRLTRDMKNKEEVISMRKLLLRRDRGGHAYG